MRDVHIRLQYVGRRGQEISVQTLDVSTSETWADINEVSFETLTVFGDFNVGHGRAGGIQDWIRFNNISGRSILNHRNMRDWRSTQHFSRFKTLNHLLTRGSIHRKLRFFVGDGRIGCHVTRDGRGHVGLLSVGRKQLGAGSCKRVAGILLVVG